MPSRWQTSGSLWNRPLSEESTWHWSSTKTCCHVERSLWGAACAVRGRAAASESKRPRLDPIARENLFEVVMRRSLAPVERDQPHLPTQAKRRLEWNRGKG